MVGSPVLPAGPSEPVLQCPVPRGPPGGPGHRCVAPAPGAAQDVGPVVRMVSHEMKGPSGGQPIADCRHLAGGQARVQVAGQVGRHLVGVVSIARMYKVTVLYTKNIY